MKTVSVKSLDELVEAGVIQLTRGKIISKTDMAACPGNYPVYSSAKENDGKFGEYGRFMFDEDLITWSVDGGGRLFYRPKHKFSVTNVGGVLRILDRATLDYRYLFYALTLRHSEITFDWVKKAHPSVIRKLYADIPVLPIPEQQRIVGILDEAFDGIATAKANAEQNLQNARALFESHLQSVFTQRGEGWVRARMDAIYRVGSSKRVLKSEWKSEGVPFYRGREVTRLAANGFVDNELFISEEHFAELSKEYGVPKSGDIVITAIGTIGNAHIVRGSDRFYFKDASVLWMKRSAEVSSEFIKFWLKSSLFFDQLDRGNGATVDTLTIQKLQSVELFLPPIDEQLKIVAQLDSLSEETQRLESLYQRKLAALDELKKSLLHQAFSGQLIRDN